MSRGRVAPLAPMSLLLSTPKMRLPVLEILTLAAVSLIPKRVPLLLINSHAAPMLPPPHRIVFDTRQHPSAWLFRKVMDGSVAVPSANETVVPSTPDPRFIRAEVTAIATLTVPVMAALARTRRPVSAIGTIHCPLAVAVVT